jgi:hypothetical protein
MTIIELRPAAGGVDAEQFAVLIGNALSTRLNSIGHAPT